jgi:hypothetical protein
VANPRAAEWRRSVSAKTLRARVPGGACALALGAPLALFVQHDETEQPVWQRKGSAAGS